MLTKQEINRRARWMRENLRQSRQLLKEGKISREQYEERHRDVTNRIQEMRATRQ